MNQSNEPKPVEGVNPRKGIFKGTDRFRTTSYLKIMGMDNFKFVIYADPQEVDYPCVSFDEKMRNISEDSFTLQLYFDTDLQAWFVTYWINYPAQGMNPPEWEDKQVRLEGQTYAQALRSMCLWYIDRELGWFEEAQQEKEMEDYLAKVETAIAQPRAIWKCPFCTDTAPKKSLIQTHIKTCSFNPDFESCNTCKHCFEDGAPISGFNTGCNAGLNVVFIERAKEQGYCNQWEKEQL